MGAREFFGTRVYVGPWELYFLSLCVIILFCPSFVTHAVSVLVSRFGSVDYLLIFRPYYCVTFYTGI